MLAYSDVEQFNSIEGVDLDARTCPIPHIPLLRLIPSTQSSMQILAV